VSGRFQAANFLTGKSPLSELKQAFASLLDRANGGNLIKTVILPAEALS